MKYKIGTKFLLFWDSTDINPDEIRKIIGYVIDNTDRVKYLLDSNISEYSDQYEVYTEEDILNELSKYHEKVEINEEGE